MVLPGVYVSTVPTSYVVDSVVVVVTGAVVVCSVVVVLVCANATGAISAQASVIILFFINPPLLLIASVPTQGTAEVRMRPFILRRGRDLGYSNEFVRLRPATDSLTSRCPCRNRMPIQPSLPNWW